MASCNINLGGSNSRKYSSTENYDLPDVGSVVIQLLTKNGISKFLLTSLNENGTRIIILSPFFVVCNFSKEKFNFWSFCVSTKDTHSLSVDNTKATPHEVPYNVKCNTGSVVRMV